MGDREQRTGEMEQRMADKGYRGRETGDRRRETMDRGSKQGTDCRGQRAKCFDPKNIKGLTLHLNQYDVMMVFKAFQKFSVSYTIIKFVCIFKITY